jgi:hypothetical protein
MMSTDAVGQMVQSMVQPGSLTEERFAALLGASLQLSEMNSYWATYTFNLPQGLFAQGAFRLNAGGNSALLVLAPRDPPGLGRAELDQAALVTRLGRVPNPRIPPESADTETFMKGGVRVATQWTVRSRRLLSLFLRWELSVAAGTQTTANARHGGP